MQPRTRYLGAALRAAAVFGGRETLGERFARDELEHEMGRVARLLTPFEDACAFDKRVRDLSGIERFHSHLCRHSFATECREAGGSLAALQAVLDRRSIWSSGRLCDSSNTVRREAFGEERDRARHA